MAEVRRVGEKPYDISSTYPLLMRVAGVLEETGTADDLVILRCPKPASLAEVATGRSQAGRRRVDRP